MLHHQGVFLKTKKEGSGYIVRGGYSRYFWRESTLAGNMFKANIFAPHPRGFE
jgi:hypothetical protein